MNSKQTEGTACNLSNAELIDRVEKWVHKLAETGGQAWTLRVPVDFNLDPDMLIIEVCKRFSASLPSKPVGDVEEMAKEYANDIIGDLEWLDMIGQADWSNVYEAFKSGYAAAPQKGMKWVKASERLPERKAEYFVIIDDYKAVVIFDGVNFFSDDDIVTKSVTRWLDESPSPSEAGDAVEFAEFVTKNYSFIVSSGYYAKSDGYKPLQDITWYTIQELYHQFKKQ